MGTLEKVKIFLDNPTQEGFDGIKDYALSLRLVYTKFEDKSVLFKFFGFEEWKFVYNSASGELKELSLQKMLELAQTFEEWKFVYNSVSGELKELSLQKMLELAQTFEEWEYIRIVSLAQTFEEWECVYNSASGELKELSFQKMGEFVW